MDSKSMMSPAVKSKQPDYIRLVHLIVVLFFLATISSLGQHLNDSKYKNEPLNVKKFDNIKWNDLNKELNYHKEKAKEKKRNNSHYNFKMPFVIDSIIVKSVLFILAAAILVFIVVKLFGISYPSNSTVNKQTYTLENIEESLHEADLERFLRQAIQDNDYRQIIRLYYLIIIRELSSRNWITWKRDKTNNEYLNEMRKRDDFKMFRDLTYMFEVVWYSKKEIPENQFLSATIKFKAYIENIKAK